MSDLFQITPPQIRAEGKDVPPEQIQAGFNSLARQTQNALNTVGSDPTGPAGGDLSGNYPNPTVSATHATSGTINGVVIGGVTPAAGSFTTVTASTPVSVTSGGTGQNALNAHNVIIGEGSSAVAFAAPGAAGQMLLSTGTTTDPAFGNAATVSGGVINSTPIGQTTPAAGSFTTLTATTAIGVASGGTGQTTLTAHGVLIGEGTSAINQTAVGTTGQMLLGVTGADPAFGNNPTITGGTINGATVGQTTPAAGSFTTLTSTGNFTPSQTNGIVGTTTNNNANAGSVGEVISATSGSTGISNATTTNITSISLTAGDWDVYGLVQYTAAGSTVVTGLITGISQVSATIPGIGAFCQSQGTLGTGTANAPATPVVRVSIASTTTVYLIGVANFTVSTMTTLGFMWARRAR